MGQRVQGEPLEYIVLSRASAELYERMVRPVAAWPNIVVFVDPGNPTHRHAATGERKRGRARCAGRERQRDG